MYRILLLSALVSICCSGHSQIVLSGKVIRSTDGSAIAFANIGILDTDVGTISDEDGSFAIHIPHQHRTARLLFSALGYKRLSISIDSAANFADITVTLAERVLQLKPVTVTGEGFKRRFEFGNRDSEGGTVYADTETAGAAMALLIENRGMTTTLRHPAFRYPALVERVSVGVEKNTFREFKIRVRLLAVDSVTGKPGRDLLNTSIVATSRIKKGWLKIDLLEHFIIVDAPFYLAFEWILQKKDRQQVHREYRDWAKRHPELVSVEYSIVDGRQIPYVNYNRYFWAGTSLSMAVSPAYLEDFKCYYRYSSFSEWTRSSSILAATITLSN